jgi:alpha-tubulin suppressor-like RCC1 family protein
MKSLRRIGRAVVLVVLAAAVLVSCARFDPFATFTVTYDANGGVGAPPQDTTTYSTGFSVTVLDAGDVSRSGYRFGGWNSEADGSGTLYPPLSTLTVGTRNIVLYADWRAEAETFTITYDANGGVGTVPRDAATYLSGETARVLSETGLSRGGHRFVGWNTEADGSGTLYQPDGSVALGASDLTLYATWRLQGAIALGSYHSASLRSDGSLYIWGWNSEGELGFGDKMDRSRPTRLPSFGPAGTTVTAVALGLFHSAALLSDGSLYTWGRNLFGQLGLGDIMERTTPTLVPSFLPAGTSIAAIAVGFFDSLALLSDGSLYTWGSISRTPTRVPSFGPAGTTVIAIASGLHFAALLSDGSLYTWGDNRSGQLGHGTTGTTYVRAPTLVPPFGPAGSSIAALAVGDFHSAALLSNGSLYTWGQNSSGQLGLGDTADRSIPTLVPGFPATGTTITAIALGEKHSAALLSDGSLYTWGDNSSGQLGRVVSDAAPAQTPHRVTFPDPTERVTAIALGGNHSAALLSDGSLYTWGWNNVGQLGLGDGSNRTAPTLVTGAFRVTALDP